MTIKEIKVPDLGNVSKADVIEIAVKPGDNIKVDDSLITLESDKASMDIPAPFAGVVKEVKVKVGDKVGTGSVIVTVESAEAAAQPAKVEKTSEQQPVLAKTATQEKEIKVPDLGNVGSAAVIEIPVKVGDKVKKDDSLLTLESDKASMDLPSPFDGVVKAIKVKIGDKVSTGTLIAMLQVEGATELAAASMPQSAPAPAAPQQPATKPAATAPVTTMVTSSADIHASPSVRRLAREFGVELSRVQASGPKKRILKEDVQRYVKSELTRSQQGGASGGMGLPSAPVVDFSQFGAIESKPLSRIKKLTAINLHRNWLLVPHVTQFDEADISELEAFRKGQQTVAEKEGVKLTPLVFIMKAVVATLKAFPNFNASLDPTGENLILKKYFHIGVAVDTPDGLVVPVIRDVDKKGLIELAKELGEISVKARKKALTANDMQGSTFTISSLGGIGGTAFTPIVNLPDVAILVCQKRQ